MSQIDIESPIWAPAPGAHALYGLPQYSARNMCVNDINFDSRTVSKGLRKGLVSNRVDEVFLPRDAVCLSVTLVISD